MTKRRWANRRVHPTERAPRAGLFGLLGQGNLGNDGSLVAVLAYLRARHPDVVFDVLCTGPDVVSARYDVPAAQMRWHHAERTRTSGLVATVRRFTDVALGVTVDTVRIASWVRRHDAVIVPGMGVLETTVPMRPWKTPYWMFLLSASGRLFGTKVALVSTGANFTDERLMRTLISAAARLASFRSFRDTISRDSMQRMGLDTSEDAVYPDVAFSLPAPRATRAIARSVGIGVMDYCGRNVDRQQADDIRASYIEKMTGFALWLVDNGHPVRLFTSDPVADAEIIRAIVASLRVHRPELGPSQVTAEPVSTIGELMRQTSLVEAVVATRYHNILYALKLAKPTISLGYATKCDVLMADMGMSSFCLPVKSFALEELIERFEELVVRSTELRLTLSERSAARRSFVGRQFGDLSHALFGTADDGHPSARLGPVQTGMN